MYGLQIQKLVAQANNTKNYDDKIELTKQAISIADFRNDVEWGIELRKSIMEYEYYTPHFNETFLAINWFIGMSEIEPDLIDNEDFLWNYKHAISEIIYNPSISLESKNSIETDYIHRMTTSGFSKRPIYDIYYRHYITLGNAEKASHYLALRNKELHDGMSNCEACELDSDVDFELHLKNIEKAKILADPLLNHKKTCARVPLITNISFVKYFAEKGEYTIAETYYKQVLEILDSKDDKQAYFKYGFDMLNFLIKTNQMEQAVKMIEEGYNYLKNGSVHLLFFANKNIIEALRALDQNTIEIKFPEWFKLYQSNNQYHIPELIECLNQDCLLYVNQIDERNQNDEFENYYFNS
jgi:hypothetical protein